MVFAWTAAAAAQSPFATRVIAYEPAPGQRVNDDAFKHPQCALGAPIGGGQPRPRFAESRPQPDAGPGAAVERHGGLS